MRRRYADPDYLAAFLLLGLIFTVGFVVGAVFAYVLRAMI